MAKPLSGLKIIREEKDVFEVEFIGEDLAYVAALRDFIIKNKGVEVCAVKKEHPEISNPVMLIKAQDPRKALINGLEGLNKTTDQLLKRLK